MSRAPGRPPVMDAATAAVRARIVESARETWRDGANELTFQALGTRCRVCFGAANQPSARQFTFTLIDWLARFEAKYSRFLPTSLISRINATAGGEAVSLDEETEGLFALCDQIHFLTRGAFDPATLPLIQLWNWKTPRPTLPTEAEIEAARELSGWGKVERRPGSIRLPRAGMGLDLGGIGKEYAVDQVAELLASLGAQGILVDFGADVRVIGLPLDGRPGWHIGLDDPRQPGRCWCGLGVREGGVATSGDYVRRFELHGRRYGHILDFRSGRPVANGARGVSVLAANCTFAGLLSTAAFVLGPEEGLRLIESQYGAEGAILTDQGTYTSRRFYAHVVS